MSSNSSQLLEFPPKKKRNLPGTPDPSAEVIALSPKTLMATNRYVCEICNKGFQRDQNLQLHRRGHNLPWKLRQRSEANNSDDQLLVKKKVYICPETSCVHHKPCRALGDLTGIKKHYSRKHGEKRWKCGRCNKKYAVQSDWKAHSKTCGSKEYKCSCGTIFSRKDSFMTHRAFCDALAQENRLNPPLEGANMDSILGAQAHNPLMPTKCTNSIATAFDGLPNLSHGLKNASTSPVVPTMPAPFDMADEELPSFGTHPISTLHLNSQGPMGPKETEDKGVGSYMSDRAHISATELLHRVAQSYSSDNWSFWPMIQKGTSAIIGPDNDYNYRASPYSPLKANGSIDHLSELNQVVGSMNQNSGDDSYYNWMREMGMYSTRVSVSRSDGLTGDVENEVVMAAGRDGGSEHLMTLDFLGVEAEGRLIHAAQQRRVG